ncbi:unnamed protein product, partial [marine sediment metagenome]
LKRIDNDYKMIDLRRAYFSSFIPIEGTPLSAKQAAPLEREHRLYQTDWLLRIYHYKLNDLKEVINEEGNLPRGDPKIHLAEDYFKDRGPVVVTMMGKDIIDNSHPLFCWSAGSKGTTIGLNMTSKADVILALGCRFADETTSSYKNGISFAIPPTKLIHIDIDPHEIGKNYPVSVGIVGDVKACLGQILGELRDYSIDYKTTKYFKEMQEEKKKWFDFLDEYRDNSKVPVMISTVIREVRKFFDRDAVIVTSSGNVQAQMLQELEFYEPKTCLTAGGFSTMGYSIPAAIGAKLGSIDIGKQDRQVVALVGDGDFMMTIS